MKRRKHIQQLDSFRLLNIGRYLQKGGVEIRHEPFWYDKEKLPYMKSTQPIFFDEVHIQQVSGPPMNHPTRQRSEERRVG